MKGYTPNAASTIAGISSTMGYRYEEKLFKELPTKKYEIIRSPHSHHARQSSLSRGGNMSRATKYQLIDIVKNLRTKLRQTEFSKVAEKAVLAIPGQCGHIAEQLVLYRLMRRSIEAYKPTSSISGTDILVIASGRPIRCEIKSTMRDPPSVRLGRTVARKSIKQQSRVDYAAGIVDFYILVDLQREYIFVIPFHMTAGKSSPFLTPGSWAWAYKDKFDLLKKCKV